jgi:REP element-mobilizing transposase RayT
VKFPATIRLVREAYANPDIRFHVTIGGHPEVHQMTQAVLEAVWRSVLSQVEDRRIGLFAACLMPDHLHMVVSAGELDVVTFVQRWKSWSTRIAWQAGHVGPLWQPSFWDRAIRGDEDFDTVCGYVLRNPVAAGLVDNDGDWPWAWVYWLADGQQSG